MHSTVTTALLALLAIPLGWLASVQLQEADLSRIFGSPPRSEGDLLYQFDPRAAARITITSDIDERGVFEKSSDIWVMHEPHEDRADFASLQTIAFAAASMRIERAIPVAEADLEEFGFTAGSYTIEVIGGGGQRLAHYQVGRRSALHRIIEEKEQVQESLFIKPLDQDGEHLYVCSGVNVRPVLSGGVASLRDRHPFLFDPKLLAAIEVRRAGSLLQLVRQSPGLPWRITKPLELRADPEAVAGLLASLKNLTALRVSDPEEVTAISDGASAPWLEITLTQFPAEGAEKSASVTLTVAPPASETAATTLASVDNRSGLAVFELPLTGTASAPGLSRLPLAVNQLRSKTLLSRDFLKCTAIEIHSPLQAAPIFLQRDVDPRNNRYRWRFTGSSGLTEANERTMKKLYTALQFDRVSGFASDAPADLGEFGLADPDKRLVLHFGPDDSEELHFGRVEGGRYFARKADSPTVVEIGGGTYAAIATTPYAWRDSFLWNLSIFDLQSLKLRRPGQPDLLIRYDDLIEQWSAVRDGEDVTALLNTGRARNYLDFLETLEVERWLGPDQPTAAEALADPTFTLEVGSQVVSNAGDVLGTKTRILEVAPISRTANNKFYYGKILGDPDYFVLDLETYQRLTLPLLDPN